MFLDESSSFYAQRDAVEPSALSLTPKTLGFSNPGSLGFRISGPLHLCGFLLDKPLSLGQYPAVESFQNFA